MGNVNKVILIGHLGADPELKKSGADKPFCHLSVATNEVYKDAGGHRQERTDWHRVTVFGDTAEHCARYLGKGRSVFVEGRLAYSSWTDKEGQKRYSTEIVARRVLFLSEGRKAA
jgi:single-strand DNA-binding protein